jgi:hypothetical protein
MVHFGASADTLTDSAFAYYSIFEIGSSTLWTLKAKQRKSNDCSSVVGDFHFVTS